MENIHGLNNLIAFRRPRRKQSAEKISESLIGIKKNIAWKQSTSGAIFKAWNEILPSLLKEHCQVSDFSRGVLLVRADLPVYAAELRMCSRELLAELKKQCPRSRINLIKVEIGKIYTTGEKGVL
ncbi:MAG: DUF721 domain-containing protein [Phycisphaerae bacterium]|nr:DUF721 domain-containing protein [Phycisphaerae bacterium]